MSQKNNQKSQVFFAAEILQHTKSETQTLVLSHLAYFHASKSQFKSSVSAIAKHLSFSINAVKSAIEALVKKELITQEVAESGFRTRTIKLNTNNEIAFKLLQSFQAMFKKHKGDFFNLYSVDLDLFKSESRYDSRHKHKALMLKAIADTKIKSSIRNSKNKKNTYTKSIPDLCKITNWSYMTVKNLIQTIKSASLNTVVTEKSSRALQYIFSLFKKPKQKTTPTVNSSTERTKRPSSIKDILENSRNTRLEHHKQYT